MKSSTLKTSNHELSVGVQITERTTLYSFWRLLFWTLGFNSFCQTDSEIAIRSLQSLCTNSGMDVHQERSSLPIRTVPDVYWNFCRSSIVQHRLIGTRGTYQFCLLFQCHRTGARCFMCSFIWHYITKLFCLKEKLYSTRNLVLQFDKCL